MNFWASAYFKILFLKELMKEVEQDIRTDTVTVTVI